MKNKQGWLVLLWAVVCAIITMIILGAIGSTMNSVAGDYYSIMGAIIGFMMPPIVYFGNRVDK